MARIAESSRRVVLTGATGSLGRYLLRDLLLAGHRVTALVRDSRKGSATERIATVVAFWEESLGRSLPPVAVVISDLTQPRLGLTAVEYQRLATWCDAVIHSAASLAFRPTASGEPRKTNFDGTANLLDFCGRTPRPEFHHVSTAYICGEVVEPPCEDGPVGEPKHHNVYERSKFDAERLVRNSGIRATIYRPSVLIGDCVTGYTSSYEGMYRFIELASRMAEPDRDGRRFVGRLPWTGDEPRNLVPVDWVSRTMMQLFQRPQNHGRIYHLVAKNPVPIRMLKDAAEAALQADMGTLCGPGILDSLTPVEKLFLEHLNEYVPYLGGDPVFDRRNLESALPDLAEPKLDRSSLERMLRFAVRDDWGRRSRLPRSAPEKQNRGCDCTDYMERFFPEAERIVGLARLARLSLVLALEVSGPGGGGWSCHWVSGELATVRPGFDESAEVRFRTDAATFTAMVLGGLTPQEAFYSHRLSIDGDLESALKLGVMFAQFLKRAPYQPATNRREA